jgi:hypothetical protein
MDRNLKHTDLLSPGLSDTHNATSNMKEEVGRPSADIMSPAIYDFYRDMVNSDLDISEMLDKYKLNEDESVVEAVSEIAATADIKQPVSRVDIGSLHSYRKLYL